MDGGHSQGSPPPKIHPRLPSPEHREYRIQGVHPSPFPRKIQPLWQPWGSLWDSLEFMGNRPGAGHGSKARLCLKSRISAGIVLPFSKDFIPSPRFPGNCIPGIQEWGVWVWRSLLMEDSRFKSLPELLRSGEKNSFSHSKFPSLCPYWYFPIFDGFSLKRASEEDFFPRFQMGKKNPGKRGRVCRPHFSMEKVVQGIHSGGNSRENPR